MKWYGDPDLIGKEIKKARKEKKISQQELADRLTISRELLSKWENGERIPGITNLNEIAEILEVDFIKLVSGYDRSNIALEDTGLSNEALSALRILNENNNQSSHNALAAVNILLKNSILLSLIGQYLRDDFAKTFLIDPGDNHEFLEVSVDKIKTATFPYLPIDLQRSTLVTIQEYLRIIRDKELGIDEK